jgi:hypothetical protein
MLFFTLPGIGFDEFAPGVPFQIVDQVGVTSKLIKVVTSEWLVTYPPGLFVLQIM